MYPFLLSANWYGFVPAVCKHYRKSELHWPKGPLFRESGAHIHHLEHFFRTLMCQAGYKHKRSPWWLRNKGWDSVLHISVHFLYTYSTCKFSTCVSVRSLPLPGKEASYEALQPPLLLALEVLSSDPFPSMQSHTSCGGLLLLSLLYLPFE